MAAEQMPRFIVAEVSKSWTTEIRQINPAPADCLNGRFERVIQVNLDRGYMLHSWKMTSVNNGPEIVCETIIAVFELQP